MPGQDPSTNLALPSLPPELEELGEIALNLWWTWNPAGKNLFRLINPYLWKESGHNPIQLLKTLSAQELEALTKEERFMREYRYVRALFREYMNDKTIYSEEEPLPIAYFCAEFGLHHSVPIYSGGLGFLAGDILKEASDMGLPMVGVGFMYPEGYVRQVMSPDGWQQGASETIDKDTAPIERVLDEKGDHLVFQVPFIDPPVYASLWKLNVGRVSLYLLDTDIEQNDPWDRQISSHLYTPDMNQRLRQEIVLGIGGYRALEILGIKYSILHLNEGHPAFALFERIRSMIEEKKLSLDEAIERVRASSVFTTHTPLQAATDVYNFDMMSHYFGDYWKRLGMDKERFMSFGLNPDAPNAGFNMTVLGLKLCNQRNAVSQKHAEVTRQIWKNVLAQDEPGSPPIVGITNGVHLPTWLGDELRDRLDELLGERWLQLQEDPDLWSRVDELEDEEIWQLHYTYKVRMVNFIRERVRRKWSDEGIDPIVAMAEGVMLDPDVLTIGFARRMTAYKRPDLILHDLDRLEKIVNNYARPVQIIFAGKAHPADQTGKQILQRIFKTAQDRRFRGRIAFVEDYGEGTAKYLVRGCDVWLNNPQIPMEACGTSGMKAAINGTLHCSTLDGWWPEGYNGKNGWAFGGEISDDAKDAAALYDLLEKEIVPLYYTLDEHKRPAGWIAKMRESIRSVSPRFGSRRMMKEYLEKFYLPVSQRSRSWEN
ncbi:alpha-glucan family phosphorylase [Nitratifractor salsuginis]|uniref:Alpha-glucan phosphorylase n=1 Tax=Nitratifractor salsuginis (strain DSM 16511 / JCM 12458 / E9I37-1) TaxID=749222 RepID=E6X3H5_NITSE|nr:alpha-glucan family phosphorylase [Nitratifractor salsuginis]ADV46252.1 alpha-glucan phosphorylase [Nitratifractor salsuginis DSM 16511]